MVSQEEVNFWLLAERVPWGKCCFKCARPPSFNDGKAHTKQELDCKFGEWKGTGGCCENFILDRSRFFSIHYQQWTIDLFKKKFGTLPLEAYEGII